nr:MAG TPA: hypothetical protein [Bacteriophage sp.]
MSGPFLCHLQRLTAYTVGRFSFLILVTAPRERLYSRAVCVQDM